MDDPLTRADVSVIIPCYRCADTIERAVESVAAQTLPPAEIILVDDRSGDGTLSALYALQSRYPEGWIRVIEQPENRGPGEARNAGWEQSGQSYIAFLDADDTWHPQKIELQYQWMLEHPDVALTGHSSRQLHNSESPLDAGRYEPADLKSDFVTMNRLLWGNCFPTRSVMLRSALPMRFASGKYHSEDYHLWLTIGCSGERMARSSLPLAFMHKAAYGEGGLSGQLWKMQKGQLDSYRRVRSQHCVGRVGYLCLVLWSGVRFIRRLLMVAFR